MTILYIMIPIFIIASVIFYGALMLFYPEWVGMAGKDSKKILEEQKAGSSSEDISLFKEMSDVNKRPKSE